jgi:hypothetical protein
MSAAREAKTNSLKQKRGNLEGRPASHKGFLPEKPDRFRA